MLCAFAGGVQQPSAGRRLAAADPLLGGFIGTGLFISELLRNRRMVLDHLNEVEMQVQARREAEEQLQVLVESSPAAIITLDGDGTILLANEAAQQVLAPGGPALPGQNTVRICPLYASGAIQEPRTFAPLCNARVIAATARSFWLASGFPRIRRAPATGWLRSSLICQTICEAAKT